MKITAVGLLIVCVSAVALSQTEGTKLLLDEQGKHLKAIAQSDKWLQDSVDKCNMIFDRENVTLQDWELFFDKYFRDNAFTDPLRNYLAYPVFGWLSDRTHDRLQRALVKPMINNVTSAMDRHKNDWDKALVGDPVLYQTVMNSLRFLNMLGTDRSKTGPKISVLPQSIKDDIFKAQCRLISKYPQWLTAKARLDSEKEPWAASVRAQLWMNLRDADPLDAERKKTISNLIGLSGLHLQLWDEYSILMIDNGLYDRRQIVTVYSFLRAIPRPLVRLGNIGNFQDWNSVRHQGAETFFLVAAGYISIPNAKPGSGKTITEFPDDIAKVETDSFGMVLAHEFNHTVKGMYFTPELANREKQLIEAAGKDAKNYLRSMFGDDVFVKGPQEFFASIANEYFADTAHTLQLGLKRFNDGRVHPLDQFLFFADVYSLGKNETKGYRTPGNGKLIAYPIPLERDEKDRIISMRIRGKQWRFIRDKDGKIMSCR